MANYKTGSNVIEAGTESVRLTWAVCIKVLFSKKLGGPWNRNFLIQQNTW
jgi:hypothetical protein